MSSFQQNVINLYGNAGQAWLDALPSIVQALAQQWQLSDIQPVSNMSWHYVAKAVQNNKIPVVLKIGCDRGVVENEVRALQHFDGHGAVNALVIDTKQKALLLQQAVPGVSLKSLYPANVHEVVDAYSAVVKELTSVAAPAAGNFPRVRDWLKAFDRVDATRIPQTLFQKANTLQKQLLNTADNEILLHGDLHHDNILKHGNQWLAIDPKGIIGELAFEAAAFDFIHLSELESLKIDEIQKLFCTRVSQLAEKLNIDPKRLSQWVFVRLILMALWFIEDGGDPQLPIRLAKLLFV